MDAADCIPQGFFSRNLFKKAWKIVKTAVKKNVVAELSSFRLPLSDSNLKWTSAIMITLVRIICLNFPFLRSRVKVWLLYSAGRRARWDLERTNWVKAESESKWITPYNNRAMRKWDKKKHLLRFCSTWAWSCDLLVFFPCGSSNTCDKLQEVRLHWSLCARLGGFGGGARGEERRWREGFFFKGRGEEKACIMLCSQKEIEDQFGSIWDLITQMWHICLTGPASTPENQRLESRFPP